MAIGKTVKGITIEFNGETTKLGKALEDVDKETRNVDKSLKEVNHALKFNPKNTELLTQKQQMLGKKVEETEKKLGMLKKTQSELDDDPAVDKSSQDYMELRREIIETESKLKNFKNQQKKVNEELKKIEQVDFDALGKKVKDAGDKMKGVGEGMSKYVSAPIVGGAAASVAAFKEVDEGLDIITKKTGASGKSLDEMKESAKNLAQEIPTDFETAGSAIGEVNTRFGVTGKELEDLSGKFIKFANLNDTDVSDSVDKVQKAMTTFGLPAEQAGDMLDILNKVGQDTGISMDTLTESLVTNAPQLQAMGFSAEQAASFVGQLEKSGVDSTAAMTGLKKALVNGAKDGKALPEVMNEIKDSIVNASDETEAMNAASAIFGSKAGPAIATAARNGSLDFDALAESALDASGSVEDTFENTQDPADKFTTIMNSLKVTGYEVGSTLLEAFAPALEKVGEILKGLAEKWKGLSSGTQTFIIKAALLVAAIGPVLTVLGLMTTGIGSVIMIIPKIVSGFRTVGTAFKLLSTIMTASPWMLVAAAAVAAIVLIVKNWDKIKEFFSKLWKAVKEKASAAWKAIKKAIVDPVKDAVSSVKDKVKDLKEKFGERIDSIKEKVTDVFKAIKEKITQPIRDAVSTVKDKLKELREKFGERIDSIKKKVTDVFKTIKDKMTKPIRDARDKIKEIIDKIKGFFDFEFKIPKIKLPHISVSPAGWSIGDIFDGVIPSLDIDWYAKGGIFKTPQVVGIGDVRGGEAALPLEPFWERFDQMADRIVSAVSGGGTQNGAAVFQGSIVIDGQVVANVITPIVNRGLQRQAAMDGRNA